MNASGAALIGPNAVTRLAEALADRALADGAAAERVFGAAGLQRHLADPPTRMVPDEDVARLHAALRRELGGARATAIGDRAGRLTAKYLLANRIPRLAQRILGLLPAGLALSLLLRAIGRHAWTFAGSGRFSWRREGGHFMLSLAGGPVARGVKAERPVCAYYAATFEHLFQAILRRPVMVVETACEATGAEACEFTVVVR